MRAHQTRSRRTAERLLRVYPPSWRERYSEEFRELLIADLEEMPHSWRRTSDVMRGGLIARLARLGLATSTAPGDEQVRAGLVSLACCAAVFVSVGAAMWSQLTIGWQWSAPDTTATTVATVATSLAVFALMSLALLAAAPALWRLASELAHRRTKGLAAPTLLVLVGALATFLGGRHFANGWPGTGGHHWAHQGLVPGGLAAFSWASSLSVSSYWAHPSALARFPADELTWMVLSPLALAALVVGLVKVVRRLPLSPSALRFEIRIGQVACISMATFLTGSCLWVADGGPGPRDLFRPGAIDVIGIVVMALAVAAGHRAVIGARRSVIAVPAR